MSAKNAAVFVAADMNAVTGVGAPWYTSGVHMWNGAAETLNANPIASSDHREQRDRQRPRPAGERARHPAIFVVPVAPYAIATPYRKNAEANAPSRKYFTAASVERVPAP